MIRRPNKFLQEHRTILLDHPASKYLDQPVTFFVDHAQVTATTELGDLFSPSSEFLLEEVRYINPTGLAGAADDWFDLQVLNGVTEMATWTTDSDEVAEGTIAAGTFIDLVNESEANRTMAADDVLSIDLVEGGTATLPAGRFQLKGRYYSTSPAETVLWTAERRFLVQRVVYVNPTGLSDDATNFFVLEVKNGATVVADWSTETGQEGAITADTPVEFTLSSTQANRILAAGDELSFDMNENGSQVMPAGRIIIEGNYLE